MKWAVTIDARRSDGTSLREHNEAILNRSGIPQAIRDKATADLTPPVLPAGSEYLLALFYEVNCSRRQGMNGWEPLSWVEVEAYLRLTERDCVPWEIQLLRVMDRAWRKAVIDVKESQ